MIASDWKLTLDPGSTPLVLLDYGQMLDRELAFSGQRGVRVTPLVRSAAPHLQDGKNVSVTLSFRVHLSAASWALARAAAMATALAALAKAKAPLRVATTGISGYTQYAECLVSQAEGAIDEDEGQYYALSYSLVATNPTITP